MKRFEKIMLAAALLVASSTASAQVCNTVNAAVKATAAGVATQVALATAPLTAVAHSSGALILTGTSGYLATTLGVVAGVWAVATAPVTIVLTTGALVTGASVVAACQYMRPD